MEEKKMYFHCNNCGVLCKEDETYCHNCGESFVVVTSFSAEKDADEMLVEDVYCGEVREYLSHNSDRYISLFKKNIDKKFYVSANCAAIILSPMWYLFRRMYKFYFIGIVINYVMATLIATALSYCNVIYEAAFIIVTLMNWVFAGLIGDCLYQHQVINSVRNGSIGGVSVASAIFISLPMYMIYLFSILFPVLL